MQWSLLADLPTGVWTLHDSSCHAVSFFHSLQGLSSLGSELAMHVAGLKPLYLDPSSVEASHLAHERQVLTAAAASSGKPAAVVDKMVEGRLKKWYQEVRVYV